MLRQPHQTQASAIEVVGRISVPRQGAAGMSISSGRRFLLFARLRMATWLTRYKENRTAHSRLANTWFLRQAVTDPKYVTIFYLMVFAFVVPVYFVNYAVDVVATWVGCVLVWGSVVWSLAAMLAASIVFPGSVRLTSRKFEIGIASEIARQTRSLVHDVVSRTRSEHVNIGVTQERVTKGVFLLERIAKSLSELSTRRRLTQKGDTCLTHLKSFLLSIEEWKSNPMDLDAKVQVSKSSSHVLGSLDAFMDCRDPKPTKRNKANARVEEAGEEDQLRGTGSQLSDNNLSDGEDTIDEDGEEDEGDEENQTRWTRKPRASVWRWLWEAMRFQYGEYIDSVRPFRGLISFDWARLYLEMFHEGESRILDSHGYKIDTIFFAPDKSLVTTAREGLHDPAVEIPRRCVIMCNPNAARYEQCALHPFWIEFYRSRGNHVLCWNYRGYGRSTGWPSPPALAADICTVVDHVVEDRKCQQVMVHGESIGGIAACVAAANYGPGLPVIADRTFASLDAIATVLTGKAIAFILRVATGWQPDNVKGFLSSSPSPLNRLILQDVQDEIVRHPASLKLGVASELFTRTNTITRERAEKFLTALESIAASTARPSFSVPSKPENISSGLGVIFPPFASQGELVLLKTICTTVLNIDGQHGEPLGSAVIAELERRIRNLQMREMRFVKLYNTHIRRQNGSPDWIREFNQHFVFDWFACCYVFSREENNDPNAFTQVVQKLEIAKQACGNEISQPYEEMVSTCLGFLKDFAALFDKRSDDAQNRLPGALISLKCGHNGQPSSQDLAKLQEFISKAGFSV